MSTTSKTFRLWEQYRKPEHAYNLSDPGHVKELIAMLRAKAENLVWDSLSVPMMHTGEDEVQIVGISRAELPDVIFLLEEMGGAAVRWAPTPGPGKQGKSRKRAAKRGGAK